MKHAIVSTEMLESDIRPPGLRARFREVALGDAKRLLPRDSLVRLTACPACSNDGLEHVFEKYGYVYGACVVCQSVFALDRPTTNALKSYYRDSEAGRLRNRYLAGGGEADISDVLRARVDWIATFAAGRSASPTDLLDIGTSYAAVLAELGELGVFRRVLSMDPPASVMAELAATRTEIVTDVRAADIVTAFEQIEHQADPRAFVALLTAATRPGGLLFLTTRSISGFDLQILWENSPYIFFPEHLNLFSIEGLQIWLEQSGFDVLELSTPGHLDIEFVRQAVLDDPSVNIPRFVRYLLERRGTHAQHELQVFLQKSQLSSHVRIVAQRREATPRSSS